MSHVHAAYISTQASYWTHTHTHFTMNKLLWNLLTYDQDIFIYIYYTACTGCMWLAQYNQITAKQSDGIYKFPAPRWQASSVTAHWYDVDRGRHSNWCSAKATNLDTKFWRCREQSLFCTTSHCFYIRRPTASLRIFVSVILTPSVCFWATKRQVIIQEADTNFYNSRVDTFLTDLYLGPIAHFRLICAADIRRTIYIPEKRNKSFIIQMFVCENTLSINTSPFIDIRFQMCELVRNQFHIIY